ncbi:MAG: tetratricopeptide repeat protein [Candidatus Rokuibacteriota bacterium]
MKTRRPSIVLAIAVLTLTFGAAGPTNSQDAGASLARLGKVRFSVSCNPAAQKEFEVAMAYYHSFAWPELRASLERVLQADPSCGMTHWGRALGYLDNPFLWPGSLSPKVLAEGQAAIDAARGAGLKTQRERDYVEALAVFFKDTDKLNHRTRAKALEDAMQAVAARYPEDTEATVLYALVLSANFDPIDKKYTNQLRAAKTLEPVFQRQPDHPGVAHYLIHSYDYPPIAAQGLDAAQRYAKIAPDAAHAQHMPSHIFTRVGQWKESVESNRQSAKVDGDKTLNSPHAYDYMVYALLQLGQDRAAAQVNAHAQGVTPKADHVAAAYAYAAMPARIAIERGAWQEAAKLPMTPAVETYQWKKYPQAEAINALARGVGAAMSGDAASARAEVARLQALRDTATSMKITYWAEQVDIQAEVVRGLAACADGKTDECLAILRAAADREDATEKHAVTPGPILPAREVLAAVLLKQGKAADALREFEMVLVKEPNRYRALAGALQAAERAGDTKKTTLFASRIVDQTSAADSPRPEITQARRMVGK